MKCPVCDAWTDVKYTRANDDNIERKRECGNGHRFVTEEKFLRIVRTWKRKDAQDAIRIR